ncbi:hypothetical protein [Pseudovibrio sp. Tun.PSC04-5.I4]|uniref:hypothetical protein n=1 Tax=Pseudovibrio sp. Tun.PSC04-5.I4 TaxID=1798213 RepID=UPI000891C0DF|nr:hypothetical protein [Pseudovibrio sp. Tun.PSC04-5.I4]SDR02189.1 hypothetical protein SAMN04515695_2356 [Pseudovibrio sp. Tun.PSC04-5.I4]
METKSALSLVPHYQRLTPQEELDDVLSTTKELDLLPSLKMMCLNLFNCADIEILSEPQQQELINQFRPTLLVAYKQQILEQEVA